MPWKIRTFFPFDSIWVEKMLLRLGPLQSIFARHDVWYVRMSFRCALETELISASMNVLCCGQTSLPDGPSDNYRLWAELKSPAVGRLKTTRTYVPAVGRQKTTG